MAKGETDIAHAIMMKASTSGHRLFKNVRGLFWSLDGGRKIKAGLLADGASDLIGFTRVTITPEMVGETVAIFTAVEVKKNSSVRKEQRNFMDVVQKNGGIACVARAVDDYEKNIN